MLTCCCENSEYAATGDGKDNGQGLIWVLALAEGNCEETGIW